ncbi:hypothetical protein UFOVP1228_6 [uncultured Caudovirales phage]|uniref:Uncharacterized protein n=1 Tax=uncultured Caudovirales phage TaxID=2100421 RepID=A0A6J5R2B4_9CAUD|nr:hypothetical protein UFOVP956_6 [uncultured Caudovirales phage]CAB4191049.1 hypothetical protein UFOVP1228_6 [uncultured Caudovirales phage]CAB4215518.1 hypothetical protein UFOVP1481_32 [uncultured Caudovirales phage]
MWSLKDLEAKVAGLNPDDITWAKSVGEKYSGNSQWLGDGDAARHLALGYVVARTVMDNPSIGKGLLNPVFLADMRESGLQDYIPGYESLDNEMDRRNNKLGQELAALAPTKAEAEVMIHNLIAKGVNKASTVEAIKSSKQPVVIAYGSKPYTGAPYGNTDKGTK